MKRGLTGVVPVRNGDSLDYCWRLAVDSMLGVCDEVLISDGESTDGTLEASKEWAEREPKIRVLNYPWDNPVGDHWFLSRWINWSLKFAEFDMQCQLDADEAFDPASYAGMRRWVETRQPAWFHRINLWDNPEMEAPHGTVCAHEVVRLGPIEHPAVCDNHHPVEPWVNANGRHSSPALKIWHLGFLRHKDKFLAKSRDEQKFLLNTFDSRLARCEQTGEDWVAVCPFPQSHHLIRHGQAIPEFLKTWLRERGHQAP